MTTVLRVVAWSEEVQAQYAAVCQKRRRMAPVPPAGVAILDDTPRQIGLVCAVGLFPCPPYLLADHFVTNPSKPPRIRRLGAILAIQSAKQYAVVSGLTLRAFVESSGLRILLKKQSFLDQPAVGMFFANLDLAFPVVKKEAASGRPEAASPQGDDPNPQKVLRKRGKRNASPSP